MGAVAYELNLPPGSQIHPVFHVSQLKERVGNGHTAAPVLPLIYPMQKTKDEPEGILGRRMFKRRNAVVPQILVKWLNKDEEEASWEDYEEMKAQFPDFILRDKDEFEKGGVSAIELKGLLAVGKADPVNSEEKEELKVGRNGQQGVNSSGRLRKGPGQAGSEKEELGQLNREPLQVGPEDENVNRKNGVKQALKDKKNRSS